MKQYLTEGVGTFFLVLIIIMTVNNGTGALAPVAIGLSLMALVYAGMPLSGAQYNPAVTIALFFLLKMDRRDVAYYILAQIIGAVLAALIGSFMLHSMGASMPEARQNEPIAALLAEFLGAFMLMFVILQVAVSDRTVGNPYFGFVIGLVVTGLAYTFGPVSGAVFNPAVAVGISMAGMAGWSDYWIYIVGSLLGATSAAALFKNI